jgi:hypothetical protein
MQYSGRIHNRPHIAGQGMKHVLFLSHGCGGGNLQYEEPVTSAVYSKR